MIWPSDTHVQCHTVAEEVLLILFCDYGYTVAALSLSLALASEFQNPYRIITFPAPFPFCVDLFFGAGLGTMGQRVTIDDIHSASSTSFQ